MARKKTVEERCEGQVKQVAEGMAALECKRGGFCNDAEMHPTCANGAGGEAEPAAEMPEWLGTIDEYIRLELNDADRAPRLEAYLRGLVAGLEGAEEEPAPAPNVAAKDAADGYDHAIRFGAELATPALTDKLVVKLTVENPANWYPLHEELSGFKEQVVKVILLTRTPREERRAEPEKSDQLSMFPEGTPDAEIVAAGIEAAADAAYTNGRISETAHGNALSIAKRCRAENAWPKGGGEYDAVLLVLELARDSEYIIGDAKAKALQALAILTAGSEAEETASE